MSFAEPDDVMSVIEACYTAVFEKFAKNPLRTKPFPRMTYDDAMRRYGTDRPDTRFAMEIVDLTEILRATGFGVFRDAIAEGGAVRAIVARGKADASRKDVEAWTDVAKTRGARGLVSFGFAGSEVRSPVAKFFSADELSRLQQASGTQVGDLVLAGAGEYRAARPPIGGGRRPLREQPRLNHPSAPHMIGIPRVPMVA